MAVVAEYLWLTDPAGAVRVRSGKLDMLVVENEWAAVAGPAEPTTAFLNSDQAFTTSAVPGEWVEVFTPGDRQEAYVGNVHSDPSAVVLVEGGPYGPKPVWPDGPGFVTSRKGSVRIMSPTHPSVRCCGSEV